jgi:hypothetical protein
MTNLAKRYLALLSLSALTSMTAYAANPGTYLGLGLGAGKQSTSNLDLSNPLGVEFNQSRSTGGLAGRAFTGYNFNEYFGIETGLTQYSQAKTKFNAANLPSGTLDGSVEYRMTTLDLVGKGYLPLVDSGFNLYGLGGVSWVHSTVNPKASVKAKGAEPAVAKLGGHDTNNAIRPIVGLGASYDIPQTSWTTGLEYSHTFGKGNVKTNTNAIPAANLVTLNIIYNLG